MQENDCLISVLMVLVVVKLWICADLDRSKADLWKGKEDVQLQQKASIPPWSSIVSSASPTGACGSGLQGLGIPRVFEKILHEQTGEEVWAGVGR